MKSNPASSEQKGERKELNTNLPEWYQQVLYGPSLSPLFLLPRSFAGVRDRFMLDEILWNVKEY